MTKPFEVGDKVSRFDSKWNSKVPSAFIVVKRVLKRFVELEDGTKWTHDGWRYPKQGNIWNTPHITHTTEEHLKVKKEHTLRSKCIHLTDQLRSKINKLPPEALELVCSTLQKALQQDDK